MLFRDAPKETDMSETILHSLSELVGHHKTLGLLMSSTDELDIGASCKSCGPILPVRMDSMRENADFSSFVDWRMHDETRLRQLP